jgi:hypothetical protein
MPKLDGQTTHAAHGAIFTLQPVPSSDLARPFVPMSALSEASTPAQEAASASIDTQQLHLHNSDSQQQPVQNGSSASGNESGRKRPYSLSSFGADVHSLSPQQKHRP